MEQHRQTCMNKNIKYKIQNIALYLCPMGLRDNSLYLQRHLKDIYYVAMVTDLDSFL